jgi:hypothetical protein
MAACSSYRSESENDFAHVTRARSFGSLVAAASLILAACVGSNPSLRREPDHTRELAMNETVSDSALLDRLAVRELIERSSDLINHQEWTRLMSLFIDDIVWERRPPMP